MFARCCESKLLAAATTQRAVRRKSISEVRSRVAKDQLSDMQSKHLFSL